MADKPSTITLTTADADGNQDAAGWELQSGLHQVVVGGTFGGATVQLQVYDAPNTAWVATSHSWTSTGSTNVEISSELSHRFFLSAVGAGASIDITTGTINRHY